ncbi:MAG: amidohydrolase family protein [Deltaproteobacteria bacterium]
MRIDLHVHLAAAGIHGAEISTRFRRSLPYRALVRTLGLSGRDDAGLSSDYAERLVRAAEGAKELDGCVLLALDRPYSEVGLPLPGDLFVPTRAAAEVAHRSPRLYLGASVHPYRPDALEALEEAKALGAVLVKWLPNVQHIDPASPRCLPFYRRLRELGLPLLSHTGNEHTLPRWRQEVGAPGRLEPALDLGVTVIAAHAGTGGARGDLEVVTSLARRHPRFFVECSGCATPTRFGGLLELLQSEPLRERWVFGSDYPVPIFWPLLWGRSDRSLRRRARAQANPLDARALALLAAGVPGRALTRGAELLGLA